MTCAKQLVGVCLNKPLPGGGESVFGFPEFLTALALLVLVYNVTDARYRFRVKTAPLPLFNVTFVATAIIGAGTLLAELWFSHKWIAPAWGFSRADIQIIFGSIFLLLTLTWTWFGFLSPARFGRTNARRYVGAVYHFLMRGGPQQYDALSRELLLSSRAIIRHASHHPRLTNRSNHNQEPPKVAAFARQVIGLLPHRPFCRYLVRESPITVISLLEDAALARFHSPEIGQFAHQIANAAIEDTDSILYHELEYFTGIIGNLQSFKKALFGNYELVESSGYSSLDLDHRLAGRMNGRQVDVFGECVVASFKSYVSLNSPHSRSYSLNRAINCLSKFAGDLGSLDGQSSYPSEPYDKTRAAIHSLLEMVKVLDGVEGDNWSDVALRPNKPYQETICDVIAQALLDVALSSGNIAGPFWTTWSIQHNTIWSPVISTVRKRRSPSYVIVFKFRRLLFDEIKRMEDFPNYQGARALRFCLNVLPWSFTRDAYPVAEHPLREAVMVWVKNNFASLQRISPEVAAACLTDRMEYDVAKLRLTKRHEKSILSDGRVDYLIVKKPPRQAKQRELR